MGSISNVKDSEIPFGLSAEEVIKKHVAVYNIPLCFNFPAGHIADNRAVVMGKKATLTVEADQVTFVQ